MDLYIQNVCDIFSCRLDGLVRVWMGIETIHTHNKDIYQSNRHRHTVIIDFSDIEGKYLQK